MEKKCIWSVIISCISTAISLACIGIVTCDNFKTGGVVTIDTFIGVIAALIGVCATIMVGLQIWNHIEFRDVKDKVNEINAAKEEISITLKEQQDINDKYTEQLGMAFMLIANGSKDIILRSNLLLEGIILTNQSYYKNYPNGERGGSMLGLLQTLKNEIKAHGNYCLEMSHLSRFKNMEFPKEHPDYCNMVATQMEIIKIIEANNEKAKQNNAKTKDAQPK